MKGNRVSLVLLVGGSACVIAGVGLLLGMGAALVTAGVLAIAAEWLIR